MPDGLGVEKQVIQLIAEGHLPPWAAVGVLLLLVGSLIMYARLHACVRHAGAVLVLFGGIVLAYVSFGTSAVVREVMVSLGDQVSLSDSLTTKKIPGSTPTNQREASQPSPTE